jgi:uncharacterized membrane protein YoaT (DUF817 family)
MEHLLCLICNLISISFFCHAYQNDFFQIIRYLNQKIIFSFTLKYLRYKKKKKKKENLIINFIAILLP